MRRPRAAGVALALLLAIHLASRLAMLAATPTWFRDVEELHNATVARELLLGAWPELLRLQYMHFCGGCTGVAVVGAGAFALGGVRLLTWKLVPLAFSTAIGGVGALALARLVGRPAGLAFAAMWALSPTLVAQAGLTGWGNHHEGSLFLVGALAAASLAGWARLALLGLLAGLGAWFCASTAWAAPLLAAVSAARRRPGVGELAAWSVGLALGSLPLLLAAATWGGSPLAPILERAGGPVDVPASLAQLAGWPYRAHLLQAPWKLLPGGEVALAGLWTALLLGLRSRSPEVWALGIGATLLLVATPLQGEPVQAGRAAAPIVLRYLVPVWVGLLVVAAAGIGAAWSAGRRLPAGLALAAWILPGAVSQAHWIAGPGEAQPPLAAIAPWDYDIVRGNGFRRLGEERLLSHLPADRLSRVNRLRAVGLLAVDGLLGADPAARRRELARLASLGPEPGAVLQGVALELGARVRFGLLEPDRAVEVARAAWPLLDAEGRDRLALALWQDNPRFADLPDALGGALRPALGERACRPRPPAEVDRPEQLVGDAAALEAGRAAVLRGVGACMGRAYGWDLAGLQALAGRWPSRDAGPFLTGVRTGRVRPWRVEVGPGTPLDGIP